MIENVVLLLLKMSPPEVSTILAGNGLVGAGGGAGDESVCEEKKVPYVVRVVPAPTPSLSDAEFIVVVTENVTAFGGFGGLGFAIGGGLKIRVWMKIL